MARRRLESWGPGYWRTPDKRYTIHEDRRVRKIGGGGQRTGWQVVEDGPPRRVIGRARKFNEARDILDSVEQG